MQGARIELLVVVWFVLGCGAGARDDAVDAQGGSGGNAGSGGASGSPANGGSSAGATVSGGATSGGSAGTTTMAGSGGGGTAGSAGSGGTVPHVVGECDGLGAVDEFQDITPPGVDLSGNGVTDVAVDPINTGTLYVGSDQDGIYKSTNCGADWTKVNTGSNGAILDSGTTWMVLLDPENPSVLYSAALYGSDSSLFKSTNSGVDWKTLFPEGGPVANLVEYRFFQWAALDPTNSQHFIVTFHANCRDPESSNPAAPFDSMCLGETTDAGESWQVRKVNPTGGGWLEGAGPLMFGPTNWVLGTWLDGAYFSSDSGANWNKAAAGKTGAAHLAQDGNYYVGSYYGIQRVSADGKDWETVAGSPNVFGMSGDGTRLFGSERDSGSQQPYYTAPEATGEPWTALPSPNMAHGAVDLEYEADHHLLYSANTSSGLWRMVTK